jgi:hydrogenase-4 component E
MVELLLVLFASSLLYVSMTSRLESYIKVLFVQGLIMFGMVALESSSLLSFNFCFLALETLGFKTIIIPLILVKVVRRLGVRREVAPYTTNFNSLIIASIILIFGFFAAYQAIDPSQAIKPLHLGVSISTLLIGLFIIMSRKKIITHVLGFIILENGIFMLSLSIAREMPFIVNLGVLLDIFIGIFLLVVMLNQIHSLFEELDVDQFNQMAD